MGRCPGRVCPQASAPGKDAWAASTALTAVVAVAVIRRVALNARHRDSSFIFSFHTRNHLTKLGAFVGEGTRPKSQ